MWPVSTMWLTDLMEIQFAAAMLVLLVDIGKKRYGKSRTYVVGAVASAALIISLIEFLANWTANGAPLVLSPLQLGTTAYASLYSVDKLGMLVILTILVVGLAVAVYSALKLSPTDNVGPFYALLL